MLEVARRRWPAVEFRVAHTAVQGTSAAAEIIAALGRSGEVSSATPGTLGDSTYDCPYEHV